MKVAVLGAGVVGVASAYCLSQRGHEVELVEGEHVGAGASGSNAGLLVPADSTVWAGAGARTLMLAALVGRSPFIKIAPGEARRLVPWGLAFLRECGKERAGRNLRAAHALSSHSFAVTEEIAEREQIKFSFRRNGMVFLFGDEKAREEALRARTVLRELGETYEKLSGEELLARDQGFAQPLQQSPAALYAPHAAFGDCAAFCEALLERCEARGVTTTKATVTRLRRSGLAIRDVETTAGTVKADVYVAALGSRTADIARTAGIRLRIAPARGYALTAPIVDDDACPSIGGIDEERHVAFSRTGTNLRITSFAEFSGHDTEPSAARFAELDAAAEALFGKACDWSCARRSVGFRPMTPSGVPLIGAVLPNLYVNSGHGQLGWTQACGSADLLARLIDGEQAAVDTRPYLPDRAGPSLRSGNAARAIALLGVHPPL